MELHHTKISFRDKRNEDFINLIPELKNLGFMVSYLARNNRYTIITSKYGPVDYFPRSDRLLVRNKNSFRRQGMEWIKLRLLKNG